MFLKKGWLGALCTWTLSAAGLNVRSHLTVPSVYQLTALTVRAEGASIEVTLQCIISFALLTEELNTEHSFFFFLNWKLLLWFLINWIILESQEICETLQKKCHHLKFEYSLLLEIEKSFLRWSVPPSWWSHAHLYLSKITLQCGGEKCFIFNKLLFWNSMQSQSLSLPGCV